MIGIALAAVEWLVEGFMVALISKALNRTVQRFGEQHGVEDDLEKLQNSFDHARLIISIIESLRIKDEGMQQTLKEFLIRIKDAAYDADDLLDEFQYRILKQQIEQQGDEAGNRASSSSYSTPPPSKKIKTSFSSYTSVFFGKGDDHDDDVQRIRKIKERLDDNSDALEKIYSLLGAEDDRGKKQLVSSASRHTSSFSTEPQLFGRDKELQELKELLLEPEVASGQSGFSVLSIAGIGGIGKTTLAQEVFNDSSVKKYFQLRIWVCVSENFSTDRLTKEIIEYTTKEKCKVPNFAALQVVLKEQITQERFLLVLDDVWNEDMHKWESLCAPLRSGKLGSKILVTTRSRKIADMVSDVDAIHLKGLDEKSFWDFFKKCAFGSSNSDHPHLEAVAKKIICKLKGLPLAVKILGGLLSMKFDEQYWKSILDSEIWQLPQEENEIMPVLQLSYQYLPPHLKQCFAFCSLFPKDYKFSESELISFWIAEGFIVPRGSTRMEELGSNYFHELVNRSFIQKSKDKEFIMHDLIHDLAELISVGEFYRIEKGKSHTIPNTIRHLSLQEEEEGMQTRRLTTHYNKLRTYISKSFIFDCGVLETLKKIRVLILSNCAFKKLPDSIGKLIHLRYLELSYNYNIRRLPESLCDLYNLQSLKLHYCALEELPNSIGRLIHLRYLELSYNYNIRRLPESLCDLYNLQSLKLHYCALEELPNSIGRLIHLRYLELSYNYNIRRLPESLCDLYNLQSLKLHYCALEELPNSIGRLIHLRYLELSYNYNIIRLPESLCDMYNLQTLILDGCDNLYSLPHDMMKLINLRKLDGADKFIPKITKVGKLTFLQNLSDFKVLKDNGHKLENVENKDEANITEFRSLGWLKESFMGAFVEKAADLEQHEVEEDQSFMGAFVEKAADLEQHEVEEDLKKLQDSLAHARLTISDIDNLRLKDEGLQQRLKELLIRLKDTAYDADDLLDEFQYRILKQQIKQQGDEAGNQASSSSSTPPPSKKIKTSSFSYPSGLFGKGDDDDYDDDVQRMRKIKGTLDDISVALEKICSLRDRDTKDDDRVKKQLVSSASRHTSSFSTEPQLFGRDNELKKLKDLLLKPEVAYGQSGFSVLPIAGIGGIGKTTLAQEVFNDSSVKEYFDLRIWVCVSENFSTARLTREIIEYVTEEQCHLSNLASLQKALKEKIKPERFLLVLDDVWNEDRHKWEDLCAPLRSGKSGSKILVTTRSRRIADMVGDVDTIHLEGLDEKSFWEFFKKCAFGSSNSEIYHPHLEAIAKKMICMLKGLPLAAKTLGELLILKLDEQYWKSILDSEIWQLLLDFVLYSEKIY